MLKRQITHRIILAKSKNITIFWQWRKFLNSKQNTKKLLHLSAVSETVFAILL